MKAKLKLRNGLKSCPICGETSIAVTTSVALNYDGTLHVSNWHGARVGRCNNPACPAEFSLENGEIRWLRPSHHRTDSSGNRWDIGYLRLNAKTGKVEWVRVTEDLSDDEIERLEADG